MFPFAIFAISTVATSLVVDAAYIDQQRRDCRMEGCVTQYGCVPRYSQYSTTLYCPQRCVMERCRTVGDVQQRRPCHQITSVATGQVLAASESYNRRDSRRYAAVVNPNSGDRDRWHLIVGPGNYYYIQNSDTGEYLRASDNDYVQLVGGRPTDESFLFKPELVQGTWSCVLLQSVCYRGYIFGDQYTPGAVMMSRSLERSYRESLWSVTTVHC